MLGGRYRLISELGVGGMAVVWQAEDMVLGRTVAVKVLNGKHAHHPESRRLNRDEARAAAALSHPNIAQVYDYGESTEDGEFRPYVVMEFVKGGTLQQRLAASDLPAHAAMRVSAVGAAALAAAHAEGLVHRDIKPANVMVTPNGVKVVDFGVAAVITPSRTGTRADEVYGTPAYLAPERLTDDAVAPASDVYAVGVLAYRMLSGRSPWSVETTTQMLTAHVYSEPEPLTELPGVPGYVVDLINRCLAKDPAARPSARDAAELFAQGADMRVVQSLPELATPGVAIDDQPSVLIRGQTTAAPTAAAVAAHRRPIGFAVAAIVLLAAAALTWRFWPSQDETTPVGQARAATAPLPSSVPILPATTAAPPVSPSPSSLSPPARKSPAVTAPASGARSAPSPVAPPAVPGNLARGRPATASSQIGGYPSGSAVDGNANSYWESVNKVFPQSLTVDLGQNRSIVRLVLRLPPQSSWAARTETIAVDGGLTSTGFRPIRAAGPVRFDPASGNTATIRFTATTLRFVRLTFTANTGWPAAQIGELEAYSS
jgi:serine/threonine-protein kinase